MTQFPWLPDPMLKFPTLLNPSFPSPAHSERQWMLSQAINRNQRGLCYKKCPTSLTWFIERLFNCCLNAELRRVGQECKSCQRVRRGKRLSIPWFPSPTLNFPLFEPATTSSLTTWFEQAAAHAVLPPTKLHDMSHIFNTTWLQKYLGIASQEHCTSFKKKKEFHDPTMIASSAKHSTLSQIHQTKELLHKAGIFNLDGFTLCSSTKLGLCIDYSTSKDSKQGNSEKCLVHDGSCTNTDWLRCNFSRTSSEQDVIFYFPMVPNLRAKADFQFLSDLSFGFCQIPLYIGRHSRV